MDRHYGIAALIGMALSAIGVALVWTTFQETKRTNRIALAESARATRRAIGGAADTARALVIAERNATAAAHHAQIAEETKEAHLRAWILFETINLDPAGETVDDAWKVSIQFKNSGLSPREESQYQDWMASNDGPRALGAACCQGVATKHSFSAF